MDRIEQQQPQQQHVMPAEVNWEMLDKTKFFVLGAAIFSGVNGMLYPSMVLKTRQQISSSTPSPSPSCLRSSPPPPSSRAMAMATGILRSQGLPGLYKGFGTSLLGTIPARTIYMTTLELSKSALSPAVAACPSPAAAAAANAAAGMAAAAAAQLVWTPIDVVTQRLMVAGGSSPTSSIDAFAAIARTSGIRGLYRGFGVSIVTYAPSNAVWWGSYSIMQRCLWKAAAAAEVEVGGEERKVVAIQAASAAMAGGVAAVVTAPLDTIKTRMQVLDRASSRRFGTALRELVAEGGWKACYKGLGPRWTSMTISATAMITSYEFLKRLSAKPEQ